MKHKIIFITMVFFIHSIFISVVQAQVAVPAYIKIGLFFNKTALSEVALTSSTGFEAGVWETDKLNADKKVISDKTIKITKAEGTTDIIVKGEKEETIYVGDAANVPYTLMPVAQNNEQKLTVNGVTYRGGIQIKRQKDSDMTVINVVGLEDYLTGVVPYELSASYPLEALKAQAVAARTYAIRNSGKYASLGFNLCNTTASQVYKGTQGEHPRSNQAVNETKGKIITYGGKAISALFSASDGGYTEDSVNVWGGSEPYLKSVSDPYEVDVAYDKRSFQVDLTPQEIQNKLKAKNIDLGNILSVSADSYSTAGSVLKLTIRGDKGSKTFEKIATRDVLGLQSQKYEIIKTGGDVAFSVEKTGEKLWSTIGIGTKTITSKGILDVGEDNFFLKIKGLSQSEGTAPTKYRFMIKGNGHGVGMSQIGAVGMAQKGFTYEQILTFYYAGVKVE